MASSFVDGALQDIELLGAYFLSCHYQLKDLQVGLRNLRTFLLCARDCDCSVMGSLLSRLEDPLIQNGGDFHNLCLREKEHRNRSVDISDYLVQGVNQLRICIRSFRQEIMESYITLLDYWSRQSRYQTKAFFDSLLVNTEDIMWYLYLFGRQEKLIDAFKDELVFFISFARFAELRGFEPCQLHVVAVNAARLCYQSSFVPHYRQAKSFDEINLNISELLKFADPQIHEIYVDILMASNVSRSLHILTLGMEKHVLGDFVDTLLCSILKALTEGDSFMVSLKDQVPIFYEGLRFLRTILTKHLEKTDKLHVKAKDLIGAAVDEAAIVICSLHVEGLVKEMDIALLNFLEKIKLVKVIMSPLIFSETNEHSFIDFLLENLNGLPSCTVDSIAFAKDQIQTIQEDLLFLRSFLESILGNHKHDGKLHNLWNRVLDVAYKTHFVILSLVVGDVPNCSQLEFRNIMEKVNLIKLECWKIVDNHYISDSEAQKATNATNTSNPLPSQGSTPAINNIVLPLDDEEKKIKEHLTSGSKKLDIISIVGMPGLGKTTLARSVYNNPSVRDFFHTSAWCVVSQAYKKKDLLHRILGSVDPGFSDDKYLEDNDQWLEEKLRKCLLKKKYLIVLDDVWDIEAWSVFERSFPDDANSSRILLTSRNSEVAKKINPNREPHSLRQLTDDECWDLLQKKLSCIKNYPLDLGMKIAKNCRGLPLTVVIIAGILVNSDQDGWEGIARRLSLSAQCMDILELSFKILPKSLKSCFLYFGSFPEDAEIPVKKLIWFWIAEGFIEKSEPKSLEDVAEQYINDLIGRSLILISKERSIGGVKTCRIHDLLHEFCVVKARKEKFMSLLSGHDELFTFHGQRDLQRLCVLSTPRDFEKSKLSCPGVRSLMFLTKVDDNFKSYHVTFIFHFFKLLKVLDLIEISLGSTFPSEIALLVELRYLAIRGTFKFIPSAIANLSNLETLLIYAAYNILLPDTIWNMSKLRVLWSFRFFLPSVLYKDKLEGFSDLHNLNTFTLELSFGQSLEKIMRKLPNIRKLRCKFHKSGDSIADCNEIVVMDFLSRLDSLHLRLPGSDKFHIEFRFSVNLKKLTLLGSHSCMIPKGGELPNLVALKLGRIDFEAGTWHMNEEWEFPNLKYLEFDGLRINRWTGTDGVDHFPCLEILVLRGCRKLNEVPSCLVDITTLQMIKVSYCTKLVESLIMQIKEYQKDNWGNDDLQVLVTNISDERGGGWMEDETSDEK